MQRFPLSPIRRNVETALPGAAVSEDWVVRYKNRLLQVQRKNRHWTPGQEPSSGAGERAGTHRLSNNVGGVKHCLSTLRPALGKERHFALVDGFRFPTKGSLAIVAVRNSVRPNHLFDHNLDHDYYFELPVRGVGCPIITPVIYDAPWRCTGSPTCEPNFLICS